mmetsp:Transcript_15310/g.41130  ORF Transcript_15310/g.41130 Transcript_15310/m.41130 type:complete len:201 (+) Transcript_15310:1029-1631(+)
MTSLWTRRTSSSPRSKAFGAQMRLRRRRLRTPRTRGAEAEPYQAAMESVEPGAGAASREWVGAGVPQTRRQTEEEAGASPAWVADGAPLIKAPRACASLTWAVEGAMPFPMQGNSWPPRTRTVQTQQLLTSKPASLSSKGPVQLVPRSREPRASDSRAGTRRFPAPVGKHGGRRIAQEPRTSTRSRVTHTHTQRGADAWR